ncbi:MAG TPA: acyltransferase family protein [Ornithinibacter sp.]|nr:acyltransferase family protein [Ornithinibacter sp.]
MSDAQPGTPVEPVQPVVGGVEPTGWLDLARIVAIAAVVLVHVVAPATNGSLVDEGSGAWWAAVVLNAASRWCVPVFLMVSGALLLDPRRSERPRDFYRKRLGRIGVPLAAWTLVYLGFRRWYLVEPITAEEATRDVLAGTPFLQLYFLFVLVGLYVLTPFLRIIVRHTTRRMQVGFVAVLLGLGALDQAISAVADVGGATAATRYVPFIGYYVAGWVLRDVALGPARLRVAAGAFVASVAATVGLTGVASVPSGWGAGGRYVFGFLSPTVMVTSLAAFLLLRAAGWVWAQQHRRRLSRLAALTFGVFLVHPLVLYPLQDRWAPGETAGAFLGWALALWVATTLASALATLLLGRLPGLRATVR